MSWVFGLTDLNGVSIGRLHWATERKLSIPLNGLPVASFTLRLDDALANSITSRNGDVLLKVYDSSNTLRFVGDCTSVEESATDQSATLACNFAGPFWRLQKRLIGKTAPGGTYSPFTAASTDPLETTFTTMLAATNTEKDTGIRPHATFGPLHEASMDYSFTPAAEIITAIQAAKIPYPLETPPSAAVVGQDDFSQNAGVGTAINLVGQVDDKGNTWAGSPSTPSLNLEISDSTTQFAFSTDVSDGADYNTGRFALNGSANQSRVVVGVDFRMNHASTDFASLYSFHGVCTRYVDTTHWVIAGHLVGWPTENGHFQIIKRNGASQNVIKTYVFPSDFYLTADLYYTHRLIIDDDGYYYWWFYQTSGGYDSGFTVAEGRDTDLASTGALPTGKSGIYDYVPNAAVSPALRRDYDNFVVATYTGPMSFDFETVPVEPVASTTYQSDGLKIAELKIQQPTIGTDRPNAIFEFGTGGRSVKSYRHVTQKEGHLCNEAYSLPETFPPDTGATQVDVRKATDATSITAHGLFQEVVPIDVGKNSLLRQAWVDANVAVRKDAKHTVTFEPSQNAPVFGTDYFVGDTVRARAVVTVNGVQETRFNGTVRVYGVDITIDENGKEEIVPDLVAE